MWRETALNYACSWSKAQSAPMMPLRHSVNHICKYFRSLTVLDKQTVFCTYRRVTAVNEEEKTERQHQPWGHRSPLQSPHAWVRRPVLNAPCCFRVSALFPSLSTHQLRAPALQREAGSEHEQVRSLAGWKSPTVLCSKTPEEEKVYQCWGSNPARDCWLGWIRLLEIFSPRVCVVRREMSG